MANEKESLEKSTIMKYACEFTFKASGKVEKSDVIGAIFGQLEGILGPELELRELQKTGKIGRIEVELGRDKEGVKGRVRFETSLSKTETTLLAAAFETVKKIGPYDAMLKLDKILDLREEKRKWIIERSLEILRKWKTESEISYQSMLRELHEKFTASELHYYGPEKLVCGPDTITSDQIIIVEGRADVINLLKYGWRNAVAIGGARIPQSIISLAKKKETIAFLDGDRGGELILKSLLEKVDIDYVARAPENKGVEELTAKEILNCLRNAIPASEYAKKIEKSRKPGLPPELDVYVDKVKEMDVAYLLDENFNVIEECKVGDLYDKLKESQKPRYLIYNGIITQRIVDLAWSKGVKVIVGKEKHDIVKEPVDMEIIQF